MPFTPFHFGPGTLAKAVFPERFSLTAFVASQVLIDVEPLLYMLQGEWPFHRHVHTLPVAAAVGVATGFVVGLIGTIRPRWPGPVRADLARPAAIVGGLLGGMSHPLLDGLMHTDVMPFWPATSTNPIFGAVSLEALHIECLVSGAVGLVILAVRFHRDRGSHRTR